MEPRAAIPRWLGFAWWWLLIATLLLSVLSGLHHKFLVEAVGDAFLLWLPIQAAWLRRAAPNNMAVFFLAAGTVGNIVDNIATYLQEHDARYAPIAHLDWLTFVLQIAGLAGLFVFVHELRRYLRRTEGYEPPVSYVWAFFFNIFYFQYKFHELYEDQLYRESIMSSRIA